MTNKVVHKNVRVTSDGKQFDNDYDAEVHQAFLNFHALLYNLYSDASLKITSDRARDLRFTADLLSKNVGQVHEIIDTLYHTSPGDQNVQG